MFIFQLIAMKSIANASHNRSLSEFQQVVLCIKHSYCRCNYCKCFLAGLKLIFKTDAGHVDKPKKFCQRSFSICMGKPVGSRFGQMVIKSQGCYISFRNHVYHLYRAFQLSKNGHKGLKLVSKNALKKWNMNFLMDIRNRTTCSDVMLLQESSHWNDLK